MLAKLAVLAPPTPALALEDQKHVPQAARFQDFWDAYPVKRGRKPAAAKWKQKNLDGVADHLIADVKRRVRSDSKWREGYIPHAATYLHQERWTDELGGRAAVSAEPKPSSHLPAKLERRTISPEQQEENMRRIAAYAGIVATGQEA
jgi:hypothetical protein